MNYLIDNFMPTRLRDLVRKEVIMLVVWLVYSVLYVKYTMNITDNWFINFLNKVLDLSLWVVLVCAILLIAGYIYQRFIKQVAHEERKMV